MGTYKILSIVCFFFSFIFCALEVLAFGLPLLILGFVFLFINSKQKKAENAQNTVRPYPPRNYPPYGNGTVQPPYGNGSTMQPPYGTPPQYPYTAPAVPQRPAGNVEAYFANLLQNCFRAYSVSRNVPGANLSTPQWTCKCGSVNTTAFCPHCGKAKPNAQYEKIDFLLTQNGQPRLAILLVTRRRWNTRSIRNTIEACEQAGIPWQRYFVEYDNESGYVISRISGALR